MHFSLSIDPFFRKVLFVKRRKMTNAVPLGFLYPEGPLTKYNTTRLGSKAWSSEMWKRCQIHVSGSLFSRKSSYESSIFKYMQFLKPVFEVLKGSLALAIDRWCDNYHVFHGNGSYLSSDHNKKKKSTKHNNHHQNCSSVEQGYHRVSLVHVN